MLLVFLRVLIQIKCDDQSVTQWATCLASAELFQVVLSAMELAPQIAKNGPSPQGPLHEKQHQESSSTGMHRHLMNGNRRSHGMLKTMSNPDTPWDCHICRPIDPQSTTPTDRQSYGSPISRVWARVVESDFSFPPARWSQWCFLKR